MAIKYDPRMKGMKISHIMRKYGATHKEAVSLRGGQAVEDGAKAEPGYKPIKRKES